MFYCQFAAITRTPQPALRNRAARLQAFTRVCEEQGLHPAQGLRLAHSATGALVNRALDNPNVGALVEQVQALKAQVASRTSTITSAPHLHPEHFLLQTKLGSAPNKRHGYYSPVLDIAPDIAFIRTQRRFNKRRYSRVRVASRPSF